MSGELSAQAGALRRNSVESHKMLVMIKADMMTSCKQNQSLRASFRRSSLSTFSSAVALLSCPTFHHLSSDIAVFTTL